MIKPEQIPDDARNAFLRKYNEMPISGEEVADWDLHCLAAAINAWPGAVLKIGLSWPENFIDLPFPQEKNDD